MGEVHGRFRGKGGDTGGPIELDMNGSGAGGCRQERVVGHLEGAVDWWRSRNVTRAETR